MPDGLNANKALILDFGGVISRTLFETHALSEVALGLPTGTLRWRGPFDPASDPLWQAMQADQISERDYWMQRTREVGLLVGQTWTEMHTFVQHARGADVQAVIRPEAVSIIEKTKSAGYKLGILSNELDLFYGADFRQRLPLLDVFDVIVDATYTGILKPDVRAYQLCCTQLGVAPGNAVFVDDQSRNIEGAVRAGLQVVHFDVMNPVASYDHAFELLSTHC